jgi:hypothetical protein
LYCGATIKCALGGIHGVAKAGVYESDDEYAICSYDVVSFYPQLSIQNKFAPEHIPVDAFCSLYEELFNERRKYSKGTAENYMLKILINSVLTKL